MAQPADDNAFQGRKRKRSLGGCSTCRSRRVKCDEARPVCQVCRDNGLTCGLYNPSLFFASDDPERTEGRAKYRRPLMSTKQQARMSDDLISLIPPQLVSWHLTRLDEQCDDPAFVKKSPFSKGPFGAFKASIKVSDTGTEVDVERQLTSDQPAQCDGASVSGPEYLDFAPYPTSPATQEMIDSLLEEPGTLQLLDKMEQLRPSNSIEEILENDIVTYISREGDYATIPSLENHTLCAGDLHSFPPPEALSIPRSPRLTDVEFEIIRNDWVLLLKHYDGTVMTLFTPFNHSKTPWHRLFLPVAKTCLAGLALGEGPDHASLGILYGTLAISALSLGGRTQSPVWNTKGQLHTSQAQTHIRHSLASCYSLPKPTKYKTQLMALLTLTHLSLLSPDRNLTETSLLETEKWIRLRGLSRPHKSRKVRLLHHCYAYERIFFETTALPTRSPSPSSPSLPPPSSPPAFRPQTLHAIESSAARAHGHDDLTFSRPAWRDLERDMHRPKTREQGENDLHLRLPGLWPPSLYREIFGVPEEVVFLVSLVVRLAREKDGGGEGEAGGAGRQALRTFFQAAKAVEGCVLRLGKELGGEKEGLVGGMYHAVVIYFYRRVLDVDAVMLQGRVAGVRGCLERYDLEDGGKGGVCVRLVWPAFIAACEAEGRELRDFFAAWFGLRARQSGLRVFSDALADAERCWQGREVDGVDDVLEQSGLGEWQSLVDVFG